MREIGKLFIDGYDAFTEYGVSVARYGYKQLIQMPSFKKLDSTEWPEEDGAEVDLTSPQLDSRTIQIDFNITNIRYAENLFDELRQGAYHEFIFTELKKTYRLRMTQNGKFSSLIKLGTLSLSFVDDFPKTPEDNYEPFIENGIRQSGYKIDDIDISKFGAYVLAGTDDEIQKAANIKDNLKISTNYTSGLIYDDYKVYYKAKDVSIKLLINAQSVDDFWERYNALYALLFMPGHRIFFHELSQTKYECYYNRSNVNQFDIFKNGKVWCEFSVTLTFNKKTIND